MFVDVGAGNGLKESKTLHLEHFKAWTGICTDPDADNIAILKKHRKCKAVQTAVADGKALMKLLEDEGIAHVDLLRINAASSLAFIEVPHQRQPLCIDLFC